MLRTVTGIEEASLDGDEGVVVVAVNSRLCQLLLARIAGRSVVVGEKLQGKVRMLITSLAILQCGCR